MGTKTWPIATVIVASIALGAGIYAFKRQSAVTDLTARLAAATDDAKQAHDNASSLSAQLATTTKEAEIQASSNQQQVQTAEARLVAEARPDLPINLSFRMALLSTGLVGVFRTTSSQEFEFVLDLESPATGRHIRKSVLLNSNGLLEIGAQQGWPFSPGQRVVLNNPAYRPRSFTVGS